VTFALARSNDGRAGIIFFMVLIASTPSLTFADGCIENSEWINTNRPIQTTSANVVPENSLQIENGTIWSTGQGSHTIDGPETLVRLGVYHCLEVQFAAPNYVSTTSQASASGFSDSVLAFEYQLGGLPERYQLSTVAGLGMPTGGKGVDGHGWNPYFQFPWEVAITEQWSASGMFSATWFTGHSNQKPTFEPTVALQRTLFGKYATANIEYAGIYDHQQPTQIIDGYLQWRLGKYQQIDLEGGFGLNRSSPEHFVGGGYSFRFDNLSSCM
jgi:hypothetical protein